MENRSRLPVKVKFGLTLGEFSKNTLNILNTFFLLWFYTDVAKLPASAATIIMLIARVWDAINDPMMGMMVDATKSKEGRCRFWLKYFSVPAGVFIALSYTVPGLKESGLIIWCGITYIFQGMAQTITNVPINTLLARLTDDRQERVKLGQWRGFGGLFASTVITSCALPFATFVGGGDPTKGFLGVAIVCGVIYAFGFLYVYFVSKGYELTYEQEKELHIRKENEKYSFKAVLNALIHNRVCLLVCLANLGYLLYCSLQGSAMVYYLQYNLQNTGLMSAYSVLTSVIGFLAVAGMGFLSKRFGNARSCAIACIILVISYGLRLITHDQIIWVLFICWGFEGIGTGLFANMIYQSVVDSITYGRWKTNVDNEGIIMAVFTCSQKVGLAAGTVVCAWLLDIFNYVGGAETQSNTVMSLFFWEIVIIPLILFGLLTFLFNVIHRYEKKIPQMIKEIEERAANS